MSYLLDTDIIIYLLNDTFSSIRNKINSIPNDEIYLSSITIGELYFGAYYSSQLIKNIELLNEFTSELNILYFDTECGKIFGKIKADLKRKGEIINDSDLFIASIAIHNKMRLVTNNDRHFRRIEDLKIENWT